MAVCWVKAGICGKEVIVRVVKISRTKAEITFETECEHLKNLSKKLREINIGEEMSKPLDKTAVCTLSAKHLCRNSCVVPAAVFKAIEVEAGIFRPDSSKIEFIKDT